MSGHMIRLNIVISILLIFILSFACAQLSMSGLYVAQNGAYFDLLADGSFKSLMGLSGNWRVSGNQVILTSALGVDYLQIEGINLKAATGQIFL